MGVVYGSAIDQHHGDLVFPLLDNFWSLFTEKEITPQRIIVLVTDQTQFFKDKASEKNQVFSPYWQDTCTLEPLLRHYLVGKSTVTPEFLTLEADKSGLDNWNEVLELVQKKLADLKDIPQNATVYVSHQAGTPAISSAVQFASLAQFGDRVEFLVSNEQDKNFTDTVKGGSYLQGIEIQQVNKLLYWHDYAGAKEVLKRQINEIDEQKDNPKRTDEHRKRDEKLRHIAYLLDVATQWNFAKFEDFADKLKEHPNQAFATEVLERRENWWWTAYEAAYLGVVRLQQGNTVEAMFHSFRAVEGLLKEWLDKKSGLTVVKGKAQLLRDIEYTNKKGEIKATRLANAYGKGLYFALDSIRSIDKNQHVDIWEFGNSVFDRRNELFHQLEGLQDKSAVFEEWGTSDDSSWRNRVMNCLNFIVKDDLPKDVKSPEEASLMSQVHTELVESIAQL